MSSNIIFISSNLNVSQSLLRKHIAFNTSNKSISIKNIDKQIKDSKVLINIQG